VSVRKKWAPNCVNSKFRAYFSFVYIWCFKIVHYLTFLSLFFRGSCFLERIRVNRVLFVEQSIASSAKIFVFLMFLLESFFSLEFLSDPYDTGVDSLYVNRISFFFVDVQFVIKALHCSHKKVQDNATKNTFNFTQYEKNRWTIFRMINHREQKIYFYS